MKDFLASYFLLSVRTQRRFRLNRLFIGDFDVTKTLYRFPKTE